MKYTPIDNEIYTSLKGKWLYCSNNENICDHWFSTLIGDGDELYHAYIESNNNRLDMILGSKFLVPVLNRSTDSAAHDFRLSDYFLMFNVSSRYDEGYFEICNSHNGLSSSYLIFDYKLDEKESEVAFSLKQKLTRAKSWILSKHDYHFLNMLVPITAALIQEISESDILNTTYSALIRYGEGSVSENHTHIPLGILSKLWQQQWALSKCDKCGSATYPFAYTDSNKVKTRYLICGTCRNMPMENNEIGLNYIKNSISSLYPLSESNLDGEYPMDSLHMPYTAMRYLNLWRENDEQSKLLKYILPSLKYRLHSLP